MKLAYQACDRSGKTVANTIEADSSVDAVERLRHEGLFVTSINEAPAEQDKPSAAKPTAQRGGGRGNKKNVMAFTRHLQLLLSTGTPIVDALESVEGQAGDARWRGVIADVRKQVEEGQPLSEALRLYPKQFDPVYCSLIGAGEMSGKMTPMLERLAVLTRKQVQIRNAIVGALVYPGLLITVAGSVMLLMVLFVLPRFEDLFETLDVALPPSTQMLLAVSRAMRAHWMIVLASAGAGAVGLRAWWGSTHGRRTVDTVVLYLPQFGKLVRNFMTARVARLLGVLLDSHLPLVDVLELIRHSLRNHHYADLMTKAQDAVTRGEPVSSAFAGNPLISSTVCEAMRSGEKSGQMAASLLTIADFMDEENDVVVRSLTSILEPLILIIMGLVVGFMAMSMFLPLFEMTAVGG